MGFLTARHLLRNLTECKKSRLVILVALIINAVKP
jgi:hypothetical protein